MAPLHRLPQTCLLLLERNRTSDIIVRRSKEALVATVANRGRRCSASARRQARSRRNDRQVARHHARSPQLLARYRYRSHWTAAELSGTHRRHSSPNVRVMNVGDIREAVSAVQRPNAAVVVNVCDVDVGYVDHAEAPAISTPPRMEIVTRTDRKPAETTPTTVAKTESKAAAPSPEGDVSGSPKRVIADIYRSRPPGPRAKIGRASCRERV